MKGFILTYSLVIGLLLYLFGVESTSSKADGSSIFKLTQEVSSEDLYSLYNCSDLNSTFSGPDQVVYIINSSNAVHYPVITQNREQSFALCQKSYRTHNGYATHLKI